LGKKIQILQPVSREVLNGAIIAADTVVIPSLSEGFGFSAAESCALGTPIVVSRVASLPEVVSGKVIFVEPGNVKNLESGLQKAVEGKFEIIAPKHFSWEKNVRKHLKLYKSLSLGTLAK
jgi:glycosyltransferase involved in cell wall biosynthesis